MRIVVSGIGKIGRTIISSLVAEGHEVIGIDSSPEVVQEITNLYDAMCVCGSGTDCETLKEAEIEKAELFVSVAGSDELNMLSCFFARKMGAKHTIARIRNPEYNDNSLGFMRENLNLSFSINPEYLAAHELYRLLRFPGAAKVETFSGRNFELIEVVLKPESALCGMSLVQMRKQYDARFLVAAVLRGEEIYIPDGNFVLEAGDRVGIMSSHTELLKLFKLLGMVQKHAKNVMILGASKTAFYLAKRLLSAGIDVKIIELNKERCVEFSNALPEVQMICGDGASPELLKEEGLTSTDAFVALTGMDEENILISFYAASHNVPKVISKVNRKEIAAMANKLGLDSVVSPRKMVSDVLTRYARALENSLGSSVETLYRVMDDKAEVLEFIVGDEFEFVGQPLKSMAIKDNILVAGIVRGKNAIVPSGDDEILKGDKVIVLAEGMRLRDLADIME